jgi:hypothetical protein
MPSGSVVLSGFRFEPILLNSYWTKKQLSRPLEKVKRRENKSCGRLAKRALKISPAGSANGNPIRRKVWVVKAPKPSFHNPGTEVDTSLQYRE